MSRRLEGIGMTSRRTRERMVVRLRDQGIANEDVLRVLLETPRHLFVEEALASRAYEDTALPIGFNQTISQPYIVARMTELLLESGRPAKVLEVGTGSGYQTAILAQLTDRVYSVERIYPLQQRARRALQELQLRNVRLRHSDGGWGWEEYAPYDAILVAAAPSEIPEALLQQMGRKSVMVLPIAQGDEQILHRVRRRDIGYEVEALEPVRFVPFLPGVL
jgi:protein-L-isoaspartate(D-aspartate) O-methyltransferase